MKTSRRETLRLFDNTVPLTTMEDYSVKLEAIRKGVQLLDKRVSDWWSVKYKNPIDLDQLDIQFCEDCVLGQIFGNYTTGKYHLTLSWKESVDHGFNAEELVDTRILTYLWKQVILGRRIAVGEVVG